MSTPARRAGARGLLLVLLALILALVAVDLLRSDSIIRSTWSDLFGPRSLLRRFLDSFRIRGPGWRR